MEVTAGALEAVIVSLVLVRFASGEVGRDGGSRVAGMELELDDEVGGVVSLVMAIPRGVVGDSERVEEEEGRC